MRGSQVVNNMKMTGITCLINGCPVPAVSSNRCTTLLNKQLRLKVTDTMENAEPLFNG